MAGLWWVDPGGGGDRRIVLEPFEVIARAAEDLLRAEGERLVRFIALREPDLYCRYRYTRRRY